MSTPSQQKPGTSLPAPSRIAPLPRMLVERIAAGEVIERPASVVRELIENALDAGTTSVRVDVRAGGMRLIRVADDGCGIAPEDLELACQPHTTSKIATLADLERVATLGFRGEALASIAAVATLDITTAADETGIAHTLHVQPVAPAVCGIAARTQGTTITARDLFREIPARHAALSGPGVEAERVLDTVRAYALAHPAVRFTLAVDGALILQTHGGDLRAALTAIYGADAGNLLLTLGPVVAGAVEVRGLIAPRAFQTTSRKHVLLVVNGRPVVNRQLTAAAESGYRHLLRKGHHPLLVAALTLPPEHLDATIHPAKQQVLLHDEAAAAAALRDAVAQALRSAPTSLALATERPATSRFVRSLPLHLPAARIRRGLPLPLTRPHPSLGAECDDPAPVGDVPELEALAQFDDTLILARAPAGHLFLVDQHRAHERALYEQLRHQYGDGGDDADEETPLAHPQMLLEPILVELSPRQAFRLQPRLQVLRRVGLDCQHFGGGSFLVRTLPHIAHASQQLPSSVNALLADAATDEDTWLDGLCVSLACRSAVRRGQALNHAEQQALLAELRTVTTPAVCPHGSPLLLRFTRSALTRAFEW